jgi:hypothetical protein
MAAKNVFPRATEKCGVAPLPPIDAGHMLRDPTVPCPPDEIQTCDAPPEDLLPEQPPCPGVAIAGGTVKTGFVKVDPYLTQPTGTFKVTASDCCGFDFDLDIGLPKTLFGSVPDAPTPCPTFAPTMTVDHGSPGVAGNFDANYVKDPTFCAYTVDYVIDFPVADHAAVVGTAIAPSGPGGATFDVTYDSLLHFTHDLQITFPSRAAYAPTFTTTASYTYGGAPSAALTITPGADSSFAVAMSVGFPCVTLTPGPSVTVGGSVITVSVTRVGTTGCSWQVGLTSAPQSPLVVDLVSDKDCMGDVELFRFTRLTLPGATAQDLGWFARDCCCPPPPPCQVNFKDVTTALGDTHGVITLATPSSTAHGDLLIAVVSRHDVGAGPEPSGPHGWKMLHGGYVLTVWWRRACAFPQEPLHHTFQAGGLYSVGSIACFSDAADPVAGTMGLGTSSALRAPGVTTTAGNQFLYGVFSKQAAAGVSIAPPPGMTTVQNTEGDFSYVLQLTALEYVCRAGPTGDRVANVDGGVSVNWEAILIHVPEDCCPMSCSSISTSHSHGRPPGGGIGPPGTITVSCCPGELLPATLYATFHGSTGTCTSVDGLTMTLPWVASISSWAAYLVIGGNQVQFTVTCASGQNLFFASNGDGAGHSHFDQLSKAVPTQSGCRPVHLIGTVNWLMPYACNGNSQVVVTETSP